MMDNIPRHVAIILDGNGRWAKAQGKPRVYGHTVGAKNVEPICREAYRLGIQYLTFYAFSTENWSRPEDEVHRLMDILEDYMTKCKRLSSENNMRVRVIGDITRFSSSMQAKIRELEEFSRGFTGLNLQIALNYGSRDEILRGIQKYVADLQEGRVSGALTEEVFSSYLDTADIPDPDFLIRTSGEQRLSNYLLWQLAYAEFYFTQTPWPDFHEAELQQAIAAYQGRDRRYGKVKE